MLFLIFGLAYTYEAWTWEAGMEEISISLGELIKNANDAEEISAMVAR